MTNRSGLRAIKITLTKLQPIHETDWDYLIILDACRYDYFKELYKN